MQIDPSQPIMFDTDIMPGQGTGTWQMHPALGNDRHHGGQHGTDRTSQIARLTLAILIGGGLIAAAINTFNL